MSEYYELTLDIIMKRLYKREGRGCIFIKKGLDLPIYISLDKLREVGLDDELLDTIESYNSLTDYVIVSAHWGPPST